MSGNLLVYVFFGLFFVFLVESIYFLKKKLNAGVPEITNQENNQSGLKIILIGGLTVAIFIIGFGWFFLSQRTKTLNTVTKTVPTVIPTNTILSPTPQEVVYTFPTVTGKLPSPTLALITTTSPKNTPTITKIPSPSAAPKLKAVSPTPINKSPIGGPASPNQGEPEVLSPTLTPAKVESTPSGVVIVPKMPVAGSIQQSLSLLFVGLSTVILGILL